MKAYSYDDNGFFVEEYECQKSPLEKGVFLIPAKATATKPPKAGPKEETKWNGTAWEIVESREAIKKREEDAKPKKSDAEKAAEKADAEADFAEMIQASAELLDGPLETLEDVKKAVRHLRRLVVGKKKK